MVTAVGLGDIPEPVPQEASAREEARSKKRKDRGVYTAAHVVEVGESEEEDPAIPPLVRPSQVGRMEKRARQEGEGSSSPPADVGRDERVALLGPYLNLLQAVPLPSLDEDAVAVLLQNLSTVS